MSLAARQPLRPAPQGDAAALIVAGGRGSRAGPGAAKQYRPLEGRAVLAWSVRAFVDHPGIARVLVVIPAGDEAAYRAALGALADHPKLAAPVVGGADRQASVLCGLEALAAAEAQPPARILIHDAARPLLPAPVITRVLTALEAEPGALAALPLADTLKRAAGDAPGADAPLVAETVPRDQLWRAQTPQGFWFPDILHAHRAVAGQALTDDAAVAEAAGLPVRLVRGAAALLKLTQPEDFALAAPLARQMDAPAAAPAQPPEPPVWEHRTGQGFDVHRFGPGDHVMLCGVPIPHSHGLAGHSDADVGLHALTDAILGAVGAGDIGAHFPPSDPRWAGADSAQFLAHAAELAAARGAVLTHVDVTLICERPKIGPHREAMAARMAEILRLERYRVSVKATTTEQLGFTGRREGVAALAAATVRSPATP